MKTPFLQNDDVLSALAAAETQSYIILLYVLYLLGSKCPYYTVDGGNPNQLQVGTGGPVISSGYVQDAGKPETMHLNWVFPLVYWL